MDRTISSTIALLLDISLQDKQALGRLLVQFVEEELDPQRFKQLKEVLKIINQSNLPSPDVSLGTLLGYLLEKMGTKTKRLKEVEEEWIPSIEQS
ncbi:hypothetical protein [Ammoniphilus sp. 3BR4]|uniref:hypothetical protein n=1 Tax=Ammoniphilus sp. 3BR4 TaxID=3158265 RepID=UPI00346760F1